MTFNRPPLTPPCGPPLTPQDAIEDPCAALPFLRADLYRLMTGRATQQVRDGDRWSTKLNGNVVELRKLIARLEIQCDPQLSRARAVRVGPYIPANPFGCIGFPMRRPY